MASEMETAIYGALLGMTDSELVEAALLPPLPYAPDYLPRAPRLRTLISATLLRDMLPAQTIIVRNVSERGMCLACKGASGNGGYQALPLGDEIVCIRLPENVEHLAQVRWVEGHAFGVELFCTLDVEALGAANRRRNVHFLHMLEPDGAATAMGDGAVRDQ